MNATLKIILQIVDLVWAEECLQHQSDPLFLLERKSNYVSEKGMFIVTTSNGISYLSEIFRRLFRDRILHRLTLLA